MANPGLTPNPDAAPPQPTAYPDVNAVLHDLLAHVRTILGKHFQGLYLSGSLALGDFSSRSSDIDFVVVTDADVSADLFSALRTMHARFNAGDSPWATEVEAAYIPRDALRRYDPTYARHPHIQRGGDQMLEMDQLDHGWVLQYHLLREHGVVVAGPDLRPLIDPVDPAAMRRAVAALMKEWWATMPADPAPLQGRGYQSYAVLTMCRILCTLDAADVVSKPVAGHRAQHLLGGRWSGLIDRALAWGKGREDTPPADLEETLALIAYTDERCRPWGVPPPV